MLRARVAGFLILVALSLLAQNTAPPAYTAASLPTDQLLSEAGPTFVIADRDLPPTQTFITYGDQRFTDPANVTATDPRVRQWLISRIAAEKPGAVILNGDVPLSGDVENDYVVFQSETKPWRDAHLNIFPALGNHEFHGERGVRSKLVEEFPHGCEPPLVFSATRFEDLCNELDTDASLLPGAIRRAGSRNRSPDCRSRSTLCYSGHAPSSGCRYSDSYRGGSQSAAE